MSRRSRRGTGTQVTRVPAEYVGAVAKEQKYLLSAVQGGFLSIYQLYDIQIRAQYHDRTVTLALQSLRHSHFIKTQRGCSPFPSYLRGSLVS